MTAEAGTACDGWDNAECVGTQYCPPRCPRYVDDAGTAYVVRAYEPTDRAALIEMYESLESEARTMGLPPSSRAAIEAWLGRLIERGWNLFARDGDRVAGHIGVAPADVDDPQFVVFVHHDYQNRGLGTELVKHAVAYAADRSYDVLTLSVAKGNRRAIHVYRNVGFKPGNADRSILGSDVDLDMRLPLSHPIADQVRLPPAER